MSCKELWLLLAVFGLKIHLHESLSLYPNYKQYLLNGPQGRYGGLKLDFKVILCYEVRFKCCLSRQKYRI